MKNVLKHLHRLILHECAGLQEATVGQVQLPALSIGEQGDDEAFIAADVLQGLLHLAARVGRPSLLAVCCYYYYYYYRTADRGSALLSEPIVLLPLQ